MFAQQLHYDIGGIHVAVIIALAAVGGRPCSPSLRLMSLFIGKGQNHQNRGLPHRGPHACRACLEDLTKTGAIDPTTFPPLMHLIKLSCAGPRRPRRLTVPFFIISSTQCCGKHLSRSIFLLPFVPTNNAHRNTNGLKQHIA